MAHNKGLYKERDIGELQERKVDFHDRHQRQGNVAYMPVKRQGRGRMIKVTSIALVGLHKG